MCPTC